MGEDKGNRGLWAGLIIAAIAAAVFLTLWLIRGGDVDRLTADLNASQATASRTARRLEDDLQSARRDADSASRKVAELESRLQEEARRAADAASQLERTLRDEIRQAENRLADAEKEFTGRRDELTLRAGKEKAALQSELEKAGEEIAAARKSARDELARLNQELQASRKTIGELQSKLAAGVAGSETVEQNLRAVRRTGAVDEAAASELTRLKAELAAAATSLAEAKNANAVLEEARNRLAESVRKAEETASARERELQQALSRLEAESKIPAAAPADESEWKQKAEELEKRLTALSAGAADSGKELAEWRQKAQDLDKRLADVLAAAAESEKRFAEWKSRAEAETQAAEGAWQSRVDAMQKEFDAWLRRSQAASQAADAAWRVRLEKAEQEASDRIARADRDNVQRLAAMEKQAAEKRAELEKDLAARLDEAKKSFAESRAKLSEEKAGVEKELAEVKRYAGLDAAGFSLNHAGRSVGTIVERLADGQTLMITGGINQRVRAGMKFDVYRRTGDRSRYLGTVKVIRPLEDFSMAVSSYDDAEILVCPITGRAVLEPGARFSPYALGRDGKPVELQKAVAAGLSLEAPAIGDYLDNPFYDPERRLIVAVPEELAGDSCVIRAVEDLGAAPRTGPPGDADYVLVQDGETASAGDGPRRVSLSHLAKYLEPRPVFQE